MLRVFFFVKIISNYKLVKETFFVEKLHNILSYEWQWQWSLKPPLWSVLCHTCSYLNHITVVVTWYSRKKSQASVCVCISHRLWSRNKVKSLAKAISHALINIRDFNSCFRRVNEHPAPNDVPVKSKGNQNLKLMKKSVWLW